MEALKADYGKTFGAVRAELDNPNIETILSRGRSYTLSAEVYRARGEQVAYTRQAGFSGLSHEQMVLGHVRPHRRIQRCEVVREMKSLGLTERRALAAIGMSASSLRYEPATDRNGDLRGHCRSDIVGMGRRLPVHGEKSALHNGTGVDRDNRKRSGQDHQSTPRMALLR